MATKLQMIGYKMNGMAIFICTMRHLLPYVPYCFAYDLENLVNKGLYFVNNFNAQPPKHLLLLILTL